MSGAADQPRGKIDCGEEAGRIGDRVPGNVEGGPVVDGSADKRKSEGDVDGAVEGECFQGDEPLIVIHADVGVGVLAPRGKESGVRRQWIGDVDALVPGRIDRGLDDGGFLVAEGQLRSRPIASAVSSMTSRMRSVVRNPETSARAQ